jgi:hypothetical protein
LLISDADRLLVDMDAGDPPLSALYHALEQLATSSGVRQLVVAIDDPRCGRQFFSSDRRRFSSSLALACGASVWTEPPVVISPDLERQLVASVAAAWRRAWQRRAGATQDDAMLPVRSAVARAARYGWSFTLVCVSGPIHADRLPGLRASLRAGDSVVALSETELVLILESARDEEVPAILARLAARDDLPGLSFGLVHCPGDGSDPENLIGQARLRLAEAQARVAIPPLRAAAAREG